MQGNSAYEFLLCNFLDATGTSWIKLRLENARLFAKKRPFLVHPFVPDRILMNVKPGIIVEGAFSLPTETMSLTTKMIRPITPNRFARINRHQKQKKLLLFWQTKYNFTNMATATIILVIVVERANHF